MKGQQLLHRLPVVIGFAALACLFSACNGGLRPTLVEDPPPTPQPALEIDASPRPSGNPCATTGGR